MKKDYKVFVINTDSKMAIYVRLQELLNEGYIIERVDSPFYAYGGNQNVFGQLIYILYKNVE